MSVITPRGGYSDDALWRAGVLAVDAQKLFGDAREKNCVAGAEAARASVSGEQHAKQVPAVLAQSAAIPDKATTPDTIATVAPDAKPIAKLPPPAVVAETKPAATKTTGVLAGRPTTAVSIRDIRRAVLPDVVRIVIEMDGEPTFHEERIADPMRIFVDLTPTVLPGARRQDAALRRRQRCRAPDSHGATSRQRDAHVLEAAGVSSYSVSALQSMRLVIDCIRETPANVVTNTVLAAKAPLLPSRLLAPPQCAIDYRHAANARDTAACRCGYPAEPVRHQWRRRTARCRRARRRRRSAGQNMDGSFSIARQLGWASPGS